MTREEAIKILRREIECLSHTKCEDCILEVACDPIKTTPYDSEYIEVYEMAISALSENKGEWIKIQSGDKDFPEIIVCNKCYHENSHLDFNEHNEPIGKVFVKSNFCPSCGADMRGE